MVDWHEKEKERKNMCRGMASKLTPGTVKTA